MKQKVTVRVPATSSNLGSGFDALGLALSWHNRITVEVTGEPGAHPTINIEGEGADSLSRGADNIAVEALVRGFSETATELPALKLTLENSIPLRRGLGSSGSTRVGALKAASTLLNDALSDETILQLATELEGHPDNAAPALHGGFIVAGQSKKREIFTNKLPIASAVHPIVLVPDLPVATNDARSVLPHQVPHADAIFNVSRAALLVSSLINGQLGHLHEDMADRLHQPYRTKLMPWLPDVIDAAMRAGALGAYLSGAGSSVLALIEGTKLHDTVGGAMQKALADHGHGGFSRSVDIDFGGCIVEEIT